MARLCHSGINYIIIWKQNIRSILILTTAWAVTIEQLIWECQCVFSNFSSIWWQASKETAEPEIRLHDKIEPWSWEELDPYDVVSSLTSCQHDEQESHLYSSFSASEITQINSERFFNIDNNETPRNDHDALYLKQGSSMTVDTRKVLYTGKPSNYLWNKKL